MVTAHTSHLVSFSRGINAGDTRKNSGHQPMNMPIRRCHTDSDDPSGQSIFDPRTFDGALGLGLSGSLPQFGHFPAFPNLRLKRSPGMGELVPRVAPIGLERCPSPKIVDPLSPTPSATEEPQYPDSELDATRDDDNAQWGDSSRSSLVTDDLPSPATQVFAPESDRSSLLSPTTEHGHRSRRPSIEPTKRDSRDDSVTPQSLEDWVKQVFTAGAREPERRTRSRSSPIGRMCSEEHDLKNTDIARHTGEVSQADGSFSRRDSRARRASVQQEVQAHRHHHSDAISEDSEQIPPEMIEKAKLPDSVADAFGPSSLEESGATRHASIDSSVDSIESGVLDSTASESTIEPRFYLPSRLSFMTTPDGAETVNNRNRSFSTSRLERRPTRRSASSDSAVPLRMEPEECSSISCELPPDVLAEVINEAPLPTSAPAGRSIPVSPSTARSTKLAFSPLVEPLGTPVLTSAVGNTSSIDHAYRSPAGDLRLASRLSFRQTDSDKITLSPSHPAHKIFSMVPLEALRSGDAPSLDAIDPVWTAGPPLPTAAKDPTTTAEPVLGEASAGGSYEMEGLEASDKVPDTITQRKVHPSFSLRGRRHFSLEPHRPLNLNRAHKRAPIARDWSKAKKRFTAAVACISTALMGMIIGIYAGEVPAIQYMVVDQHHQVILGNAVFFLGLAIPTALLYPLPLLHGRKPYTLTALTILLPLQFPPAMIVSQQRSPDVPLYRTGLLLSRGLAGLAMGFANINFIGTLLDLFGASLMSSIPHQEAVIEHDPRRHGGGMGVWLGIWTWCFIASVGLGFFIGAVIISGLNVAWGFWFMIVLTAAVLILNVITPEVRRSAYRNSMAEVRQDDGVSRRIARGEIMMHLYATGPLHWWEEVLAGIRLNWRMLRQPGFLVMAVYIGWMYAQVVLVIILLGALTSRYYRFYPQTVGLCVAAVPIGALFAIPFQKAGILSRARHRPPRTDSMTFEKRVTWTSHLVRRVLFMTSLPLAGGAYALVSGGPPMPAAVPSVLAGLVGFFSALALSECIGLIMETFDVSDLQPGMTGRRRSTSAVPAADLQRRANYSCFPRVAAGLATAQALAFVFAAAATACAGNLERAIGAQAATGVVAAILLLVTLALVAALTRVRSVQIVPRDRLDSVALRGPGANLPVIIGHPSGFDRKVSWLELGRWTRWEEIRRRNFLANGASAERIWQPRHSVS